MTGDQESVRPWRRGMLLSYVYEDSIAIRLADRDEPLGYFDADTEGISAVAHIVELWNREHGHERGCG